MLFRSDEQTAENYGLPVGIYISQVVNGSCAQAAGLQKGDIITAFNGQAISSLTELKNLLQYYKAGTQVEVTYARNSNGAYKEKTVTVTLDSEETANTNDSSESSNSSQNGSASQDESSQNDFYGNGNDSYGSQYGNGSYGNSYGNGNDSYGSQYGSGDSYGSQYGSGSYGSNSLEDFFSFLW